MGSEAYRVMRRRADASWRWLAMGTTVSLAGGIAVALGSRHFPFCFWLLGILATAQQTAVACWGLRLTTIICVGGAATVGLVFGRQWWRTVSSVRPLRTERVPSEMASIAAPLGLHGRLVMACDERPWAFTRGFFRPSVVLSRGLVHRLNGAEIEAVLWHEWHHVLRRDPLRVWVAHAACALFFWWAPARRLFDTFALATELAADACAMEHVGRRHLASALHTLVSAPRPVRFTPVLGLLGTSGAALGPRVAQIEAFPRALPPEDDPWQAGGAAPALLGCIMAWMVLLACAASLVLR